QRRWEPPGEEPPGLPPQKQALGGVRTSRKGCPPAQSCRARGSAEPEGRGGSGQRSARACPSLCNANREPPPPLVNKLHGRRLASQSQAEQVAPLETMVRAHSLNQL
ncbi:hypothetical protein G0U57_003587, partial [Chelydra serpentina]